MGEGGRVHPSVTHILPDLHSCCSLAGSLTLKRNTPQGIKGKTRWRILCGEAILEENRSCFFFISQTRFQLLVTMVTGIHVVDTLEQAQSLPPLRPPRSHSLCGLPACQAGSRCSQLLQKKQPVIVTGNADMEKLRSPPPPLQFHHCCFNYSLRQTFYFVRAHKNSRKP